MGPRTRTDEEAAAVAKLQPGVCLVPRNTPSGPAHAREAWARALGELRVVVDVQRDGADVAYEYPGGACVKSADELAVDFAYSDGTLLMPDVTCADAIAASHAAVARLLSAERAGALATPCATTVQWNAPACRFEILRADTRALEAVVLVNSDGSLSQVG